MNATDLMIGDWVYRPDCYDQVKEIRHTGVIGIDSMRGLITFSELEPIPITPEILENNGFNVNKYSDGEYYADIMFEDQGRRVEIEYRYGVDIDVCVIGRNNTPPFSRIETQVKYIHELQHIFRIMQINKEIVF